MHPVTQLTKVLQFTPHIVKTEKQMPHQDNTSNIEVPQPKLQISLQDSRKWEDCGNMTPSLLLPTACLVFIREVFWEHHMPVLKPR